MGMGNEFLIRNSKNNIIQGLALMFGAVPLIVLAIFLFKVWEECNTKSLVEALIYFILAAVMAYGCVLFIYGLIIYRNETKRAEASQVKK